MSEPIGSPQETISDLRLERDRLIQLGEEMADDYRATITNEVLAEARLRAGLPLTSQPLAAWDRLMNAEYRTDEDWMADDR